MLIARKVEEKRLAICIVDVVGKGVSAALLMAKVQAGARGGHSELQSPISPQSSGTVCQSPSTLPRRTL